MEGKESAVKRFWNWVKANKKQIIIAGIGIGTLLLIALGIKNQKSLEEALHNLKSVISRTPGQTSIQERSTAKIIAESLSLKTGETVQCTVNTANTGTSTKAPHDVGAHLRKLADGFHVSAEKARTAKENGFVTLPDDYTWVRNYRTGTE